MSVLSVSICQKWRHFEGSRPQTSFSATSCKTEKQQRTNTRLSEVIKSVWPESCSSCQRALSEDKKKNLPLKGFSFFFFLQVIFIIRKSSTSHKTAHQRNNNGMTFKISPKHRSHSVFSWKCVSASHLMVL